MISIVSWQLALRYRGPRRTSPVDAHGVAAGLNAGDLMQQLRSGVMQNMSPIAGKVDQSYPFDDHRCPEDFGGAQLVAHAAAAGGRGALGGGPESSPSTPRQVSRWRRTWPNPWRTRCSAMDSPPRRRRHLEELRFHPLVAAHSPSRATLVSCWAHWSEGSLRLGSIPTQVMIGPRDEVSVARGFTGE